MINLINDKHLGFHFLLVKIWVYLRKLFDDFLFIDVAMGYKDWASAIRGWADEKKDFIYGSKVQHGVVGHYTQVYSNNPSIDFDNYMKIDGKRYNSIDWMWFSYLS